MRVLFVSNLYPNPAEPSRGLFNAQQVAALAQVCGVVKVVAPVAGGLRKDSRPQTADRKHIPGAKRDAEDRNREPTRDMDAAAGQEPSLQSVVCSQQSVPVVHPPFRPIPLLTRPFNGWLFARAIEKELLAPTPEEIRGQRSEVRPEQSIQQPESSNEPPAALPPDHCPLPTPSASSVLSVSSVVQGRQFPFDIVLVNWAYPDAYGVMLLAQKYGFPFATTVQGSDVNVLFRNPIRKRQVLRALRASAAVFCRSEALRHKLAAEGIAATTVYNGVDRTKFRPMPRVEACAQLGLDPKRRRILYVGNLQEIKGPAVLAEAFVGLVADRARSQTSEVGSQKSDAGGRSFDLVMIGRGPEEAAIRRIFAGPTSGLCPLTSVSLHGAKPHSEIPLWMNACDVLCLPSFNEGLPNVCIEAAACGLPVVASKVGGVPEVIQDGVNGLLVPPGDPAALAAALEQALAREWDREAIVRSVARFDWDVNARQVSQVLQEATARWRGLKSEVGGRRD